MQQVGHTYHFYVCVVASFVDPNPELKYATNTQVFKSDFKQQ